MSMKNIIKKIGTITLAGMMLAGYTTMIGCGTEDNKDCPTEYRMVDCQCPEYEEPEQEGQTDNEYIPDPIGPTDDPTEYITPPADTTPETAIPEEPETIDDIIIPEPVEELVKLVNYVSPENVDMSDFSTGVEALITDKNGFQYEFTDCYMSPEAKFLKAENSYPSTTNEVLTVDDGESFHQIYLKKIDTLSSFEDGTVNVSLKSGDNILGAIESNTKPSNFYSHTKSSTYDSFLYGMEGGSPMMFNTEDISDIEFSYSGSDQSIRNNSSENFPKQVVTVDGNLYNTDNGYILDLCGHWGGNSSHRRLEDSIIIVGTGDQETPLSEVSKIEFNGEFDEESPQCREIEITYKNGMQLNKSLYLTKDSHGGHCNNGIGYRNFDKMFLEKDYGSMLIPLDNVKTIKPIE